MLLLKTLTDASTRACMFSSRIHMPSRYHYALLRALNNGIRDEPDDNSQRSRTYAGIGY